MSSKNQLSGLKKKLMKIQTKPPYQFLVFGILVATLFSCGSYQNSSYYDSDGIYNQSTNVSRTENNTNTNTNSENFKRRFAQIQESNQDLFVDVENYNNPDTSTVVVNRTGWGNQPSSVQVNIYDNSWGWNAWMGPGWGMGWGRPWGWNAWIGPGWGWNAGWAWGGWYDPFWGPGWGWGWNSWYGPGWGWNAGWGWHGGWNNNIAYNNGRRGSIVWGSQGRGNNFSNRYANSYQTSNRGNTSNTRIGNTQSSRFDGQRNNTTIRNNQSTRNQTIQPRGNQAPSRSQSPQSSRDSQPSTSPSRGSSSPSMSPSRGGSMGGGSFGGGRSGGGGGGRRG